MVVVAGWERGVVSLNLGRRQPRNESGASKHRTVPAMMTLPERVVVVVEVVMVVAVVVSGSTVRGMKSGKCVCLIATHLGDESTIGSRQGHNNWVAC